jgi:eukaryotic-like serine/threonine-protein kinase
MDKQTPDPANHSSGFRDLRQNSKLRTQPAPLQRLGRYEIVGELGRGAMGMVYKAYDPRINRTVAIKIITIPAVSATEANEYRERFFREAQAAGRLSHPGIVTIYDVDEDPVSNTPFIVMEFVPGKRLDTYVAATPSARLPLETSLDLARQIAEALDYAHAQGVVHRDIKPANIIVAENGRAMITDFGIAKLALTDLTMPGQVLGTPAFMAPEQFTGGDVDGRADLFSLGVILYWMLTGVRPFTGESTTSVSFKLVYQDPAPPTSVIPSLGPQFDAIVRRALAKTIESRYQSGEQLASDLRRLREGKPLHIPEPADFADRTLVSGSVLRPSAPRPVSPAPSRKPLRSPEQFLQAAIDGGWKNWPKNWTATALVATAIVLVLLGGAEIRRIARTRAVAVEQPVGRPAAPVAAAAKSDAMTTPANDIETDIAPDQPVKITENKQHPKSVRVQPPKRVLSIPARKPQLIAAAEPATVHPTIETKAIATLIVNGEYQFRSGLLYVSVDGERLYQGELIGDRKLPFTKMHGSVLVPIRIKSGSHSIEVHVVSEDDRCNETAKIQGEFRENEQRTLNFSFAKHNSDIQLAWQ